MKFYMSNPHKNMISRKGEIIIFLVQFSFWMLSAMLIENFISDKGWAMVIFGLVQYWFGRFEQIVRSDLNFPQEVEIESIRQL